MESQLSRPLGITRPTVPDLPGCVATGDTQEEAELQIREAIEFHIEGVREDGTHVPEPSSKVDYVEV